MSTDLDRRSVSRRVSLAYVLGVVVIGFSIVVAGHTTVLSWLGIVIVIATMITDASLKFRRRLSRRRARRRGRARSRTSAR